MTLKSSSRNMSKTHADKSKEYKPKEHTNSQMIVFNNGNNLLHAFVRDFVHKSLFSYLNGHFLIVFVF